MSSASAPWAGLARQVCRSEDDAVPSGHVESVPILVGTSGWQYPQWRGALYPPQVPQRRWLEHYASQYATVENDGTFYRLPARETFEDWQARTPADFVMAIKASRYLTHVKRLRDPAEPVERLMRAAAGLGGRLGPVLLQLPPNLRADPARLDACLAAFAEPWPCGLGLAAPGATPQVAVEPRHASWWTDETREVLRRPQRRTVLGRPAREAGDSAVAHCGLGLPAAPPGRRRAVAALRSARAALLAGPARRGLAARALPSTSISTTTRTAPRSPTRPNSPSSPAVQVTTSAARLRAEPVAGSQSPTLCRNAFATGPALVAPNRRPRPAPRTPDPRVADEPAVRLRMRPGAVFGRPGLAVDAGREADSGRGAAGHDGRASSAAARSGSPG